MSGLPLGNAEAVPVALIPSLRFRAAASASAAAASARSFCGSCFSMAAISSSVVAMAAVFCAVAFCAFAPSASSGPMPSMEPWPKVPNVAPMPSDFLPVLSPPSGLSCLPIIGPGADTARGSIFVGSLFFSGSFLPRARSRALAASSRARLSLAWKSASALSFAAWRAAAALSRSLLRLPARSLAVGAFWRSRSTCASISWSALRRPFTAKSQSKAARKYAPSF